MSTSRARAAAPRRTFRGTKFRNGRGQYVWNNEIYVSQSRLRDQLNKPALPYWAGRCAQQEAARLVGLWQDGQITAQGLIDSLLVPDKNDLGRRNDGKEGRPLSIANAHMIVKDDAAGKGSWFHDTAEHLLLNERISPVAIPADVRPLVDVFADWVNEKVLPRVIGASHIERACFNRSWGYACTPDWIVELEGWGQVMFDWKTGNNVYDDMALQLAAGVNAEFMPNVDGTEDPMPEIRAAFLAHITPIGVKLYRAQDAGANLATPARTHLSGHFNKLIALIALYGRNGQLDPLHEVQF